MNVEVLENNETKNNIDVKDVSVSELIPIYILNDDCLISIFRILTESIRHYKYDYDEKNYTEILLQIQIARVCPRFQNIFTDIIWKSKEKHLTLHPHKMYRTLGPRNFTFYIQALQWKLETLVVEEHLLNWFLDLTNIANIQSFSNIKICKLRICLHAQIKKINIRKLITTIPNLRSLSLGTAINAEDFVYLEALEEFDFYADYYPISFSYFQYMCDSLKNVKVLSVLSPLVWEEQNDEYQEFNIHALPGNIEILHLEVSFAKLALNAILKLSTLKKFVITMSVMRNDECEHIDIVNTFLLKGMEKLTGFGFNKMNSDFLHTWKFSSKLGNVSKISKLIFSSYQCIPSIDDFERFIDFQKVKYLCLRDCYVLQNDVVLKLVDWAKGLLHLDITRCYSLDVESLLNGILEIRKKHNIELPDVVGPLCIYNVDDMETPYTMFWKSQRFITRGARCPIDIEDEGIIFDFV